LDAFALTLDGASGLGAEGVTLFEAAEGSLEPVAVVAVTTKEYEVSFTSPVTVQVLAPLVLQLNPPGIDDTV